MGKSAVLTGLLALIMLLTGCSTGGKEFAIGEAAMLEITDGSTGETIQVTDPEAIRYIQPVEKPPGVRGPQPPEALIGFGDMRVKSAKSLA